MSDQPPPPKPKPGSLRDRIAAFEKPSASSAPAPTPPAPRPKPGGISWKPKPQSPPSSPRPSVDQPDVHERKAGGMSASDAKESIGKGGSLKDRMAALQGRGGFGGLQGASPPAPSKPATEKPKWKPPPRIASPPAEDDEGQTGHDGRESLKSPPLPPIPAKSPEVDESTKPSVEEEEASGASLEEGETATEVDPGEEERQRRAAIAARMARLGGARVGMTPPVFGKKPSYKKAETPKEQASNEQAARSEEEQPTGEQPVAQPIPVHPTPESIISDKPDDVQRTPDYFSGASARKNSSSSSLLSVDSASTQPTRSPSSMPVPAGPRRAAPPRKKPAKSPSPAPAATILQEQLKESPETVHNLGTVAMSVGGAEAPEALQDVQELPEAPKEKREVARQEEIGEVSESAEPKEPLFHEEPKSLKESLSEDTAQDTLEDEAPHESSAESQLQETEEVTGKLGTLDVAESDVADLEEEANTASVESPALTSAAKPEEEPAQEPDEPILPTREAAEEEDEDEATRRKRVAERLAKMGGFNPFAAAPALARRPSSVSTSSGVGRTGNVDSDVISPITSPALPDVPRRGSLRRGSRDSPALSPESPVVEESNVVRRSSIGSTSPPPPIPRSSRPLASPPPIADSHAIPPIARDMAEPTASSDVEEPSTEKEYQDEDDIREPSLDEQLEAPEDGYETAPSEARDEHEADEFLSRDRGRSSEVTSVAQQADIENQDDDRESNYSTEQSGPEEIVQDEEMAPPRITRALPPMPPPIPAGTRPTAAAGDDSVEPIKSPLPSSARRSMPPPPRVVPATPKGHHLEEEDTVTSPYPSRRSIPPPPPEEEEVYKSELITTDDSTGTAEEYAEANESEDVAEGEQSQEEVTPPALSKVAIPSPPPPPNRGTDQEILDESEGDPIDPTFHSRRRSPEEHKSSLPATSPQAEETKVEEKPVELEDDSEQSRRRTIAERMAKLGGIKFGAAPLPMSRPQIRTPHPEEAPTDQPATPGQDKPELTEDEEEQARKQRIAAKLAGMGGMRFGMLPPGMGGGPIQGRFRKEDTEESPPPPLQRVPVPPRPPLPPQPLDPDSEFESLGTSDDGVKVEAEDSELEEVHYEDAEEDTPPPVPTRAARHVSGSAPPIPRSESLRRSGPPSTSGGRPPVPSIPPARKSSVQESRKSSVDSNISARPPPSATYAPAEYVMVEEPESEELPPPPPPRSARGPAPSQAPPPSLQTATSPWELPSIRTASFDFGETSADLSLSTWSEDSTSYPVPAEEAQPSALPARRRSSQVPIPTKPSPELQLSSEELMALWGKVGVHICEVATSFFEKSKKSLVGDGSYAGFVNTVLNNVPNAQSPTPPSYGYLFYLQTGTAVQKRASDIMPGDVVLLFDAKFKGHKGLQTYHQNVGAVDPVIGIVSEFEQKKSKIKVFEANQHVGQQTVESVSYRLEDLKSGSVKIFRVLEA